MQLAQARALARALIDSGIMSEAKGASGAKEGRRMRAPTMTFVAHRNADGTVHITNMLAGMRGQHHVHTDAGLARWRRPSGVLSWLRGSDCSCGEDADKYPMTGGAQ